MTGSTGPRTSRIRRRTLVRGAAARPPSLVAVGDLLLDIVVRASSPVERGTDVPGTIRFRQGGSAANTARAFARLGGRASLVCAVGRDGWAKRLVAALDADGVPVHAVRTRAATGRLVAFVDGTGERSFVTERVAADLLRAEDVRVAWFRGAGVLHVPAYSLFAVPLAGAAVRAAEVAHEAGALVSLDLASAGPLRAFGRGGAVASTERLAPDILFATRAEAAVLTGRRGGYGPLLELANLVVVKEGADGCRVLWRTPDGDTASLDVATAPLDVSDTTGAGDAFAAGFLYTLTAGSVGRPWQAALLRRAALAGHRSAADLLRRPRVELVL